jgi:hypothetical protein
MTHKGGCHCGRIAFEVDGNIEQVIECNCSICSKRGYLLWMRPRDQLRLATPESDLASYTFKSHKIRHHFCPTCGCAPFAVGSDRSGAATAGVNVRCLEGVEPSSLEVMPFDGRSL